MKKVSCNLLISLVIVSLLGLMFAGCEDKANGNKKSRLISDENIQLKQQLEQRDSRIGELTKKIQEQEAEIKKLNEKTQANIDQLMGELFKTFGEENNKLKKENVKLKKQIEELKKSSG